MSDFIFFPGKILLHGNKKRMLKIDQLMDWCHVPWREKGWLL